MLSNIECFIWNRKYFLLRICVFLAMSRQDLYCSATREVSMDLLQD